VYRIPRKPTPEMIVDSAVRHAARPSVERCPSRIAKRQPAGTCHQLMARARWKLRRATEPAVLRIAALGKLLAAGNQQRRIEPTRIAAAAPVMLVDALEPIDQRERIVEGIRAPPMKRVRHRPHQPA